MKHSIQKYESAITLMEVIVLGSLLGIIGTVAVVGLRDLDESARETKLRLDVETLNSAVKGFILSGGDLQGTTDPAIVLGLLKSKLTGDDRRSHIGVGGATVDPRLSLRSLSRNTSSSAKERGNYAIWNSETSRFEIREGGDSSAGVEFYMEDKPTDSIPVKVTRELPFEYNRDKGWIWNYEERAPTVRLPPTPVSKSTPPEDTALPPVPPGNIDPIALPDFVETPFEMPISISVLSNDSDGDGDLLSIAFLKPSSNGMNRQFGNEVLYVPNSNFTGSDSFHYSITDGKGGYSWSTVAIHVLRNNRPPIAVADRATREEPPNLLPLDGGFEDLELFASSSGPNSNVTGGGWKNGEETADSWVGPITTGNYIASGATASPNGGVFAGSVVWGKGRREAFFTEIKKLIPGRKYEVSFFQANGGNIAPWAYTYTAIGDTVRWAVEFGGERKFSNPVSFTGFGSQSWVRDSIEFTAKSATQRLEFWSDTAGPFVGYETGLIDDIRVEISDFQTSFRTLDLLANDTDPDGDSLSVSEINGYPISVGSRVPISSSAGITLLSGGIITITGSFTETITFNYTVTDGIDTDTEIVTLPVE